VLSTGGGEPPASDPKPDDSGGKTPKNMNEIFFTFFSFFFIHMYDF
jgi:hypothetical protein